MQRPVRAIKLDLGDEHQGQAQNITSDMAVADPICCPIALCSGEYQGATASHNAEKSREDRRTNHVQDTEGREARKKHGVWIGSIEASDEHSYGTPLGVVKARAVTARPNGHRFEARAIDAMQGTPWRPSTKHQGTRVRTHKNRMSPKKSRLIEEEPGVTAEEVSKREVIFSRLGQLSNFTIKARHVLKYGPHPGSSGWKYITGEVATQSGPQ